MKLDNVYLIKNRAVYNFKTICGIWVENQMTEINEQHLCNLDFMIILIQMFLVKIFCLLIDFNLVSMQLVSEEKS